METIKKICLGCLCSSLLVFGLSCKKDNNNNPSLDLNLEKGKAVVVLNEGNFSRGNADITVWQNNIAYHNSFKQATGQALGDVLQSLYIKGDTGYFVVNNSGKIEVMHLPDFKHLHTISGLQSPRYIIPIGSGNALITEYYSHKIHVLNLTTFQITQSHNVPGWVNKAVAQNNRLYFPLANRPKLYVYDLTTFMPVDSADMENAAGEIVMDKSGRIWTASGYKKGTSNMVGVNVFIQLGEKIQVAIESASSGGSLFTSMQTNATADTIYLLSNHFYKIPLDRDVTMPPYIRNTSSKNYYGFGVHPDGRIFLSNAREFVSRGEVDVFSPQGQKISTFAAGFIPQAVHFY